MGDLLRPFWGVFDAPRSPVPNSHSLNSQQGCELFQYVVRFVYLVTTPMNTESLRCR